MTKRILNSPPPYRRIVEYWAKDGRFDIDPAAPTCFACHDDSQIWGKPERCHIIADSIGGPQKPENFVLLCRQCHREAPMTSDPDIMFRWIDEHEHVLAAMFRETRCAIEAAKVDPERFTSIDHEPFADFLSNKQVDWHPMSSRSEKIHMFAFLMAEYIATREPQLKLDLSGL
jgi:hypothetical protein